MMRIFLAILAIPLIEIALFVTLGGWLGLWLTLAWVLLTGVVGVLLLRGAAMTGAYQLSDGIRDKMRDPLSPIAHHVLRGVAGLLLFLPGFFTDALGILLLVRPVRHLLIRFVASRLRAATVVVRNEVVEEEWRDVTPDPTPDSRPGPAPKLGNPPSDRTQH
jgi:UPF0716 protein FxsA